MAAESTLELLATQPESGRVCWAGRQELQRLRQFPVTGFEKILLFYLPLRDGIDLLRVVHGRRDLETVLGGESER